MEQDNNKVLIGNNNITNVTQKYSKKGTVHRIEN